MVIKSLKKGDIIRCIKSSSCGGFIKGRTYKVMAFSQHPFDGAFAFDAIDSLGRKNGWLTKFFEHTSNRNGKLPKWF